MPAPGERHSAVAMRLGWGVLVGLSLTLFVLAVPARSPGRPSASVPVAGRLCPHRAVAGGRLRARPHAGLCGDGLAQLVRLAPLVLLRGVRDLRGMGDADPRRPRAALCLADACRPDAGCRAPHGDTFLPA